MTCKLQSDLHLPHQSLWPFDIRGECMTILIHDSVAQTKDYDVNWVFYAYNKTQLQLRRYENQNCATVSIKIE